MFSSDKDLRKPVPKKTPIAKVSSAKTSIPSNIKTDKDAIMSSSSAKNAVPTSTTGMDILEKSRLQREERQYQRDLSIKVILIQSKWRGILMRRKLFTDYCQSLTSRLADITKLNAFMMQRKNIELRLPVTTAMQLLKTALFICSDRFMAVYRRMLIINRLCQHQNTSSTPSPLLTHPWELLIQVARAVIPSIETTGGNSNEKDACTASTSAAATVFPDSATGNDHSENSNKSNKSDTFLSLNNTEIFLLFLRTILLISHIFNEKCHSLNHNDTSIAYEEILVKLCVPIVSYLQCAQVRDLGYEIELLTEAIENILLLRGAKLLQLSEEDTRVATYNSLRHRAMQPISLERLFVTVYVPLLSLIVTTKINNNNNCVNTMDKNESDSIDEVVACDVYRTRLWNIPLWPLLLSETTLWQFVFFAGETDVSNISQTSHALCRKMLLRDINILASQSYGNASQNICSEQDTTALLRHMISPESQVAHQPCHLGRVLPSIQPVYVSTSVARHRDTLKLKTGSLATGVSWVSSLSCVLVTGIQGEVMSRCVTVDNSNVSQNISPVVDSYISGVSRLLVLFPLHVTHRDTSSVVYVSLGVSSVAVAVPAVSQRIVQLLFEPAMLRVLLVSAIRNIHLYCESVQESNNNADNANETNQNSADSNKRYNIATVNIGDVWVKSEEVLRNVATHMSHFSCRMEEWCAPEEVQDMKSILQRNHTTFSSASVVRDTLRHTRKKSQNHFFSGAASSWAKKLGLISNNDTSNGNDGDTPSFVSRDSKSENKKSFFSSWFSSKPQVNNVVATDGVKAQASDTDTASRHLVEVRPFRFLLILRLFSQLLFSGVETQPGHTVWHALNTLSHGTPLLHLLLFQIFVPSLKKETEILDDCDTSDETHVNDTEKRWNDAAGHADTVLTTLFSSCSTEVVMETLSLGCVLPVHLLERPLSSSPVSRHTKTQESSFFSNLRLFQTQKQPSSAALDTNSVATQSKWLSLFIGVSLLQHALLSTDDDELYQNKGCVPLSLCLPLIRCCTSLMSQFLLHSETDLNSDHFLFSTTSITTLFSSFSSQTEDGKETEESGAGHSVVLSLDPLLRLLYSQYAKNKDSNQRIGDENEDLDTVVSLMCRETQHSLIQTHMKRFHSAFHYFVSRLLRDLHSRWTRRAFSSSPALFHLKRFRTHSQTENDEFVRHMCLALPNSSAGHTTDEGVSRQGGVFRWSGVSQLMRHMPFSVPFLLRLQWFRHVLDTQRLECQGAAPTVTHSLTGVSVTGGFRTAGHTLTVRRSRLLQDALSQLRHTNSSDNLRLWHDRFVVKYVNDFGEIETGQDAGGLFKDFFTALTEEAFHPSFGLFSLTDDKLCLFPNPSAHLLFQDPHELAETFRFLGRLLGKALYENIAIAPQFAPFFLSLLSQNKDSNLQFYTQLLSELHTFDPELAKNLLFLKNYDGDVSDLDLTFSVTDTLMGQVVERDVLPAHYSKLGRKGRDTPVTQQNRHLYVACVAKYYLHDRLQPQAEHFFKGLRDLVPVSLLSVFSAAEWQLVISGDTQQSRDTLVQDLKRHVQYSQGYSSFDPVIVRFWSLMENETLFSNEDVSLLLQFVTACPRPPSLGFQTLSPPFTIQRLDDSSHSRFDKVQHMHLPAASTCFNILKLPPYPTVEIMRLKLLQAIRAKAGFDLA